MLAFVRTFPLEPKRGNACAKSSLDIVQPCSHSVVNED